MHRYPPPHYFVFTGLHAFELTFIREKETTNRDNKRGECTLTLKLPPMWLGSCLIWVTHMAKQSEQSGEPSYWPHVHTF